jgi:glyceraldehyde-3-phosphate dehydrogenase/erythrose-4-phosphate dehydrogenase
MAVKLAINGFGRIGRLVLRALDLREEEPPENVLVVSSDHVYRMDYDRLIRWA